MFFFQLIPSPAPPRLLRSFPHIGVTISPKILQPECIEIVGAIGGYFIEGTISSRVLYVYEAQIYKKVILLLFCLGILQLTVHCVVPPPCRYGAYSASNITLAIITLCKHIPVKCLKSYNSSQGCNNSNHCQKHNLGPHDIFFWLEKAQFLSAMFLLWTGRAWVQFQFWYYAFWIIRFRDWFWVLSQESQRFKSQARDLESSDT